MKHEDRLTRALAPALALAFLAAPPRLPAAWPVVDLGAISSLIEDVELSKKGLESSMGKSGPFMKFIRNRVIAPAINIGMDRLNDEVSNAIDRLPVPDVAKNIANREIHKHMGQQIEKHVDPWAEKARTWRMDQRAQRYQSDDQISDSCGADQDCIEAAKARREKQIARDAIAMAPDLVFEADLEQIHATLESLTTATREMAGADAFDEASQRERMIHAQIVAANATAAAVKADLAAEARELQRRDQEQAAVAKVRNAHEAFMQNRALQLNTAVQQRSTRVARWTTNEPTSGADIPGTGYAAAPATPEGEPADDAPAGAETDEEGGH